MKRFFAAVVCVVGLTVATRADDLQKNFASPPPAARPWVYWFPLNGNLTKEGITADLEAMARVGIGGALYMETDQGAPRGPADFAGPLWRELLLHAGREANRLGLEINMNNDAGWCGSGGPWITPELSMQKVVWTEKVIEGPQKFAGELAKPKAEHDFYRDIAVLAMPAPSKDVKIEKIEGKASFKPQHFPPQPAKFAAVPKEATIAREQIRDVSAHMDKDGNLSWDVPAGKWLVMRFGHTTTGKDNHPAPESGRGLECDKFSKEAVAAHYRGLISKLVADYGPLVGKSLVSTHIDSWEVGSQNWTPRMRKEFHERRGYELLPFLPVYAGYVVDSREVSERFLWDLRQTVSDLIVEVYAGEFRRLANKDGLRLSIEAYDGVPCDEMTYAGQADEPMAEFWKVGFSTEYSCTEMASAAHTYGKKILGAEAFTSNDKERWLEYPGSIKGLGDWAFCEGINRFVFHRYAAQPWIDVAPGMSMGPWGLHYERTQTWWEQSKAWHEYLARCQYLLRQGLFVADVLYLQPEGAPRRFAAPTKMRPGHNFDGCTPEVLLTRASVKDGRIVLPDGMSYRVLVLPQVETMTPKLLRKVKELVGAGAVVFAAAPPQKAPGLANYPQCDEEVAKLAGELWQGGRLHVWKENSEASSERAEANAPAFSANARWIWEKEGDADTAPPSVRYFRRKVNIEAGEVIRSARLVMTADNSFDCSVNGKGVGHGDNFGRGYVMDVGSILKPGENELVVAATNGGDGPNPAGLIGTLTVKLQSGRTMTLVTDHAWEIAEKPNGPWAAAKELGPLGMAPWGTIEVPAEPAAIYPQAAAVEEWLVRNGVPADFDATLPLRYIHRAIGDTDVYFVASPEPYAVTATAEFRVVGKRPEFWWPDTGRTAKALAFTEGKGTTRVPISLEPNGSVFIVFREPATGVDPIVSVQRDGRELLAATTKLAAGGPSEALPLDIAPGEIEEGGKYEIHTASGKAKTIEVNVAAPQEVKGPWQVVFDPRRGGPKDVKFKALDDWSKRSEEGIKYYSGVATYRTSFSWAADKEAKGKEKTRTILDLGRVEVMADVSLNGKPLGTLWKSPYRVDATDAIQPGANELEVKVANLWVNRQIGDERLPEDSERNPNGMLKKWPEWLGKPSPTGRFTFTSWRLWKREDSLVPSGLLGPVRVQEIETLSTQ